MRSHVTAGSPARDRRQHNHHHHRWDNQRPRVAVPVPPPSALLPPPLLLRQRLPGPTWLQPRQRQRPASRRPLQRQHRWLTFLLATTLLRVVGHAAAVPSASNRPKPSYAAAGASLLNPLLSLRQHLSRCDALDGGVDVDQPKRRVWLDAANSLVLSCARKTFRLVHVCCAVKHSRVSPPESPRDFGVMQGPGLHGNAGSTRAVVSWEQ